MPWIQGLIFTLAGGLAAVLVYDRALNLLLDTGFDTGTEEASGYLHYAAGSVCRVACKRIEKGKEVAQILQFDLLINGVKLGARHEG